MQKTYIGGMAEIAGSTPATGAYSYYATDNLGSPRAVYSQAKALVAELDYTPYGQAYTANDTIGVTHRYTGHDWDASANLYFAPYRFYNPQLARWMSRDPLGMVDGPNVYAYVKAEPIGSIDRLGDQTMECFAVCVCVLAVCICWKSDDGSITDLLITGWPDRPRDPEDGCIGIFVIDVLIFSCGAFDDIFGTGPPPPIEA